MGSGNVITHWLDLSATFTETNIEDVELKAIPSTSSQVERIQACRARIEKLMKKEDFLVSALCEWCRDLGVRGVDEAESDEEDHKGSIDHVKFGFTLIDLAQSMIDMDYSRVWGQNPALDEAVQESLRRNLILRWQCMLANGLLPEPLRPETARAAKDSRSEALSSPALSDSGVDGTWLALDDMTEGIPS